jgi:hypothetical protein
MEMNLDNLDFENLDVQELENRLEMASMDVSSGIWITDDPCRQPSPNPYPTFPIPKD